MVPKELPPAKVPPVKGKPISGTNPLIIFDAQRPPSWICDCSSILVLASIIAIMFNLAPVDWCCHSQNTAETATHSLDITVAGQESSVAKILAEKLRALNPH